LKLTGALEQLQTVMSRPARGAWIETGCQIEPANRMDVASRAGRVD